MPAFAITITGTDVASGVELPMFATAITPQTIVIQSYQQRAYNTALSQFVTWTTLGYPDVTGAASGYPVADLTGIVVLVKTTQ